MVAARGGREGAWSKFRGSGARDPTAREAGPAQAEMRRFVRAFQDQMSNRQI
jgi:hypothetical protein